MVVVPRVPQRPLFSCSITARGSRTAERRAANGTALTHLMVSVQRNSRRAFGKLCDMTGEKLCRQRRGSALINAQKYGYLGLAEVAGSLRWSHRATVTTPARHVGESDRLPKTSSLTFHALHHVGEGA